MSKLISCLQILALVFSAILFLCENASSEENNDVLVKREALLSRYGRSAVLSRYGRSRVLSRYGKRSESPFEMNKVLARASLGLC